MFGTDTFLAAYARTAEDGDFSSLRFVVAGAEAVRPETRRVWRERFGAEIVEGFGLTEAAPVVAVNTASHGRDGTVGRLLPGMRMRLEPVEGIPEAGQAVACRAERHARLHDRGPAGRAAAARRRMARQRRHRLGRPRRLHHDPRAGRNASPRSPARWCRSARSRCWCRRCGRRTTMPPSSVPDKRRGERIVLVTTADEADPEALRQPRQEGGRCRADGARRHRQGGGDARCSAPARPTTSRPGGWRWSGSGWSRQRELRLSAA